VNIYIAHYHFEEISSAQLLIDFQNCFTVVLCKQFTITRLLHIPPQHKCVFTLPCKISMFVIQLPAVKLLFKCWPTMLTQARRRFLHSLTAVSIMFCSRPIQVVPVASWLLYLIDTLLH